MKFIILIFLAGLLLRIFIRFILPIFRISSVAGGQMRRMQEQMKEMERKMNEQNKQSARTRKEGDYIDYEEVR